MYASLVLSDEKRINEFWNEEANTYQDYKLDFRKNFSESNSKKIVQSQNEFGLKAFEDIEYEKILHGSCYALKKYYTDRLEENGIRMPFVTFKPSTSNVFKKEVSSLSEAFVLDFIGTFFTKYKDEQYLKNYLTAYYDLIKEISKKPVEAYIALVLNKQSIKDLKEMFPAKHKNTFYHYMTIVYKPNKVLYDKYEKYINEDLTLKVTGHCFDEKGQVVILDSKLSENEVPHITLSCVEGVSPVYSNELLKSRKNYEEADLNISGKVHVIPIE